jgi:hypothetical protein
MASSQWPLSNKTWPLFSKAESENGYDTIQPQEREEACAITPMVSGGVRHSSELPSQVTFSCKLPIPLGERDGIRTHDPLIKSQMLYQLSYALSEGFEERACTSRNGAAGQ